MGKPAIRDFTWVRGSTTPFIVRFTRNEVPVPFEEARLSVWKSNGRELAFRASFLAGDITYDAGSGNLTFVPTAEQTRSLTQTKVDGDPAKNFYEYEIRDGISENIWLAGAIVGWGGLNDDQGDD